MKKKLSQWSQLKSAKFNPLTLFLFVVVMGIAGYFLLLSGAAPAPPSVYLTPSSQSYPASTTFTVQVRENSGSTAVNSVAAVFTYPTSLLTFESISLTGSAFPTTPGNGASNGTVTIYGGVAAVNGQSTTPVTGDQLVATVTFETNTTNGTANLAFASGTYLVNASTYQDILGGLSATAGASFIVDVTPPTVAVTAPTNGSSISNGSTVNVTATATDNNSVSSVGIYIDGNLVTTLSSSPYTYSWNTAGVSLGSHTIQAKATDPAGNIGTSAVNTVTVADETPPTVSITAPTGGSILKGNVTYSATASDNVGGTGVASVKFYVDNVLVSTDTTSPYTFSWNSASVGDGSHSLVAKATDGAGNVGTSTTVTVTTENVAPTQPGNLQASGITQTAVTLSWTASVSTGGVTGYRITRNGTTITTTGGSTLTYNDSGLAAGTQYDYTVVALDAAGNVSTAAAINATTVGNIPGDINGDGIVNAVDLSILLGHWGQNYPAAEIAPGDSSGVVDIFDLSVLLGHFGDTAP